MVNYIAMVHMGECPPSDKGVRCKHGTTHGRAHQISAIIREREASLRRLDGRADSDGQKSREPGPSGC